MKKTLLGGFAAAAIMLFAATAKADIIYTGAEITQDFTGFDGNTGPIGWDADGFSSGTGFSENRGASAGGVGTGGTYAFDIGGGNVALGVQPGGSDFTPGYYQLVVNNLSGAAVDTWNIDFVSYAFNDQARGNSLGLSYSVDDGATFVAVAGSSFTSGTAADAAPAWTVGVDFSGQIEASVNAGSDLILRWDSDDEAGSGSRDELALDDVVISAVAVPEPSSMVALAALGFAAMLRRRR